MKFESVTKVVEKIVQDGFEQTMLREIQSIEQKAINDIKEKFEEARKEARKTAAQATIELMRKVNMNGFTIELKI